VGRIIQVELTAVDVDRAAEFYAKAFGWQSAPSPFVDGYLVAETGRGDGIDGAIMKREYRDQPAIAWIEVDDLDRSLAAVREAGGTPEGDPQEIPGIGRLAYITDTEGTLVGLHQPA
jgi:predicted enzyme related to lactoylglutathione lyase